MKLSYTLLLAACFLFISSAHGQEIPKGVNYKRGSEAMNALAKANLEHARSKACTQSSSSFP